MTTKRKASEAITSLPRKRANTFQPAPHLWLPSDKVLVIQDQSLDTPSHEAPLRSLYERLQFSLQKSASSREIHANLISNIVNTCMDWVREIFHVSIERGERLPEAIKALMVVDRWISQMTSPGLKSRWSHQTPYTLKSSTGAQIYQNTASRVLSHLWRDSALIAITLQDQPSLHSLLNHNITPPPWPQSLHSILWRNEPAHDLFMDQKEMTDAEIGQLNRTLECLRRIDPDGGRGDCLQPYWRGKRVNAKGERVEDEWYADDSRMRDAVVVLMGLLGIC